MSVATMTGDGGQTSLADDRRVSTGDARVEAYGTIDELIAQIGADLLWLLGRLVERDAGVDAALRSPDQGGKRWSKAWT